jgi:hypothetical protein
MGLEERIAEVAFAHAQRLAGCCDFLRAGPIDSEELDQDCAARGLAVLVIGPEGNLRRANHVARGWLARRPGDPIGSNLYTQLLPGTNNRLFRGQIERAQAVGGSALYLPYTLVERQRVLDLEVLIVPGEFGETWLILKQHARGTVQSEAA